MQITIDVTTTTTRAENGERTTITVTGPEAITGAFALAAAREYGRGWDTEPGPTSTRLVWSRREGSSYVVNLFTPTTRALTPWEALEPMQRAEALDDVEQRALASERTAAEYEAQAGNAERFGAASASGTRAIAARHRQTAARWRAVAALIASVEVSRG